MKLPESVLENVRREFAADCREEIVALLSTVENSEKVLFYILKLAAGDKAKVREFVEEAKRDYRNIIFWVENSAEAKLDTPEKINEFNRMLKQFGANFQMPKK